MRGEKKCVACRRLFLDTLPPQSKAYGRKLPVMSPYKHTAKKKSTVTVVGLSRGHSSRFGRKEDSEEKKSNPEKDSAQAIDENSPRIEVAAVRRQGVPMENVVVCAKEQEEESRHTGNVCVRFVSMLMCY